jgi:4-amino-4-deoxy-L-arabinose transferase-like glycosyltransferase
MLSGSRFVQGAVLVSFHSKHAADAFEDWGRLLHRHQIQPQEDCHRTRVTTDENPGTVLSNLTSAAPEPMGPLTRQPLLWIALFAFAMRVATRWYFGGADFWANGYTFFFDLAQNIVAGNGLAPDGRPPTAIRVPLYPLFLATVTLGHKAFVPVLLSQSLIGAGTVVCAGLLAKEMFGSAAAITAAALTAIYPYYVVHDTALQETSLYTFLTALAVLLLLRVRRNGSPWTAAWSGFLLGAAVLTRASLAPFAVLAPLWLAYPHRAISVPWLKKLWHALLCAGMLALTLAPWLVRSYWLTGSAVLSTQTGFFLWLGNNTHTFSRYPHESIDRSQQIALDALNFSEIKEIRALHGNESIEDQWFLRKGLGYIYDRPWLTLHSGFRKIGAAFSLLPSPRQSFWPAVVHALSYGPVMILGLCGMWANRRHWHEHLVFYGLFVSFAAVAAVFFGHSNYRSYLDVYWIVFCAGALELLRTKYVAKDTIQNFINGRKGGLVTRALSLATRARYQSVKVSVPRWRKRYRRGFMGGS